ncbi:MAG: preprotein translocase subunit YajC [Spirochaetia bacterium]
MNTFLAQLPLLMGAPAGGANAQGGSGQLVTTFVTFGLVILIFYFLIIRPQNKKKKETQSMLSSLQPKDKVATIGGIRGVVQSVKENTVVLKVDEGTKIEFSKNAIANVLERKDEEQQTTELGEKK